MTTPTHHRDGNDWDPVLYDTDNPDSFPCDPASPDCQHRIWWSGVRLVESGMCKRFHPDRATTCLLPWGHLTPDHHDADRHWTRRPLCQWVDCPDEARDDNPLCDRHLETALQG